MRRFIAFFLCLFLMACGTKPLPKPQVTTGIRGEQFGIDANINEKTIDQYLNREDSVYIDLRMLKDEANYEAIGGDSYLSGFVEGFEVVPYPYLVNVENLPKEVWEGYQGPTLFTKNGSTYQENYFESMDILEHLFPKDKTLFLMCGGGGYAGMMKEMLIALGWDENKIYNVGGYWYYEGDHKVQVERKLDGKSYYDFSKVNYHPILFENLKALKQENTQEEKEEVVVSESSIPNITVSEIDKRNENKETYAVYVYLPGCATCASFLPIISEYRDANLIDIVSISYKDTEGTGSIVEKEVEYAPSILLFENGQLKAKLTADGEEDKVYYESVENLSKWFHEQLGIEEIQDDNSGCSVQACG